MKKESRDAECFCSLKTRLLDAIEISINGSNE